MTIRKTNETSWDRAFASGDRNDCHDITATAEGLEIDYDTIPWSEIDKARAAIEQVTLSAVQSLLAPAVNEVYGLNPLIGRNTTEDA